MFDPKDMPAPVRRPTVDEEIAVHGLMRGFIRSGQGADADLDSIARWRAVYFAMMAEVDAQLGRLLGAIDLTTTVVVISADHGEMLGDHWLSGKLGWYPESYHIPCIVAGAGITAAGTVVRHFTENVDLFPTIMELIGAPVVPQCQGRSFVPFLTGVTPPSWRDAVHWEWDFRGSRRAGSDAETFNLAVLHDAAGTYVHFAGGPPLFYDLADDPHHFADRSTDLSRAAAVLDYAQRMLTWRLRTDHGELVNINQEVGPRAG